MNCILQADMSPAALGFGIGLIIAIVAIASLFSVLLIVAQWFIYAKAGQPGWAVLIPFYNLIVLLRIVGRPASWIFWFLQLFVFDILFIADPGILTGLLLGLSGITAVVFSIIITNGLSKSFGKDEGFTVGLIFLGFIFYPILGFGKATYVGPGGKPAPAADATQA